MLTIEELFRKGTIIKSTVAESTSLKDVCAIYDELSAGNPIIPVNENLSIKILSIELVKNQGDVLYADDIIVYTPLPVFEVHITGEIV